MKHTALVSFLAILVLCTTGCDSTPSDAEPEPSILPLAIGNQWILEYTSIRDSGNNLRTSTDTDTLHIVGDTTVQGERWFEMSGSGGTHIFRGFYAQRTDGIWRRYISPTRATIPVLWYKQPASTGDRYKIIFTEGNDDDVEMTLRSKEALRQTQTGTLKAYQYELRATAFDFGPEGILPVQGAPLRFSHYLAPALGFVELEARYVTANDDRTALRHVDREERWRLIAFQPGE